MDAWWFEPAKGSLRFGDGRKPVAGETHRARCEPVLCKSGLHASVRLIDALDYAESNVVWRVKLGGTIVNGSDKCAATERTYIQRLDIEKPLFDFARWAALQVVHLWDAPPVVREFLATGDEAIRDAARAATVAATVAAARATARDAAWAAARDAARDVARDAARAAARDAAWAARDAAWAAAWTATGTAARAARDAAWAAMEYAQIAELERRVLGLMAKEE